MTDKTTTSLTAASALDGTELVPIVQGGNSRKATVADVAGAASVVLADIDLATRDLRTGANPLVVTGIDEFSRIEILADAVAASNSEMYLTLSNNGGVSFKSGASDYGLSYWNHVLNIGDANQPIPCIIGSGASGTSSTFGTIVGMGNALVNTMVVTHVAAPANFLTSAGRVRAREINDALHIRSEQATTAGRLVVIGYR